MNRYFLVILCMAAFCFSTYTGLGQVTYPCGKYFVSLNGSSDYGYWSKCYTTGDFTLTAWVQTRDSVWPNKEMDIFHREHTGSPTNGDQTYGTDLLNLYLSVDGVFKFRAYVNKNGGQELDSVSSGVRPKPFQWYHIAVSFTAKGGCNLYVNGNLSGSASFGGARTLVYPYLDFLAVGSKYSTRGSGLQVKTFKGYMDELAVSVSALSQAEIRDLANGLPEGDKRITTYKIVSYDKEDTYPGIRNSGIGGGQVGIVGQLHYCDTNKPPVANAGLDQTICLPIILAVLDGSASKDADGKIVNYLWTLKTQPLLADAFIGSPNSMKTGITNLTEEGVYVFTLTVKDDKGASSSADVIVTVKRPIIANAGSNQEITLPDNLVTLDASGSKEVCGKIISYFWKIQLQPLNGKTIIDNPNTVTTKVKGLIEGKYVFKVFVKSDKGFIDSSSVEVAVNPSNKYITIAGLRIYADNIPSKKNPRTISGNVYIVPKSGCNGVSPTIMHFNGNVIVDTVLNSISGNDRVYCSSVGTEDNIDLYFGPYLLFVLNDNIKWSVLSKLDFGGLDVDFKSIKVLCDGIQITGELGFPKLLSYKSEATASISFKNLYLTSKGIDFAGGLKVSGLTYKNIIGIDNLELAYDSKENNFEGTLRLLAYLFNIDASTKWKKGVFDEINLGITGTNGQFFIPLPYFPGWGIDSVGGGVGNLSDADKPLKMQLGARISTITRYAIPAFGNLRLKGEYEFSTQFTGSSSFSIFGQDILGGEIIYSPALFRLRGGFNYKVLSGVLGFSVSSTEGAGTILSGTSNLNLAIPTFESRWLKFLNKIYPPGQIFSTSNFLTNKYLAGAVKLSFLSPRLYYILKYNNGWDYEFSAANSIIPIEAQGELETQSTIQVHAHIDTKKLTSMKSASALKAMEGTLGTSNPYSFVLNKPAENLIITTLGSTAPPETFVYLASGNTLDVYNAKTHKNVLHIADTVNAATTFVLANPPQGTYYLWSPTADSIQVSITLASPKVIINKVADNKASKTLSVSFKASAATSATHILFGLDTDKKNTNGIILAENVAVTSLEGNTILDYSNVKTGIYYLYALIADSTGQHQYYYYNDPVKVIAPASINPPSRLEVIPTDSSLIFRFNKNNDAPLNYLIHYSNDTSEMLLNSAGFNIGDTNRIEIGNLPAGKDYRFAVTAVDTSGNETDLSNVANITWKPSQLNQVPSFHTPHISPKVKLGDQFSANLLAVDPDDDMLTYTILKGPATLQISGTGKISWTPEKINVGYNEVCVKVTDGHGGADSLCFEVLIYNDQFNAQSVSFDKSAYDSYADKGMIEVYDLVTDKESISNIKVYSTSDPAGIVLSANRTSEQSSSFLTEVGFSEETSISGNIRVRKADTLWVEYTNSTTGTVVRNYALFNYIKADFLFKDSVCLTKPVVFYDASKGTNLTYQWSFDDGTVSNEVSPKHTFQELLGRNQFKVTLIITNAQKVSDTLSKTFTLLKGCDTDTTWYKDSDGDGYGNPGIKKEGSTKPTGYVANNGDCNDSDKNVHPGATEICNNSDDDCDGQVDEDITRITYYWDADGDGYGRADSSIQTCMTLQGYVTKKGDCNDTDAAVHPNAPGLCDGKDNDCDGLIDEKCENALLWYIDADSDGYGDANTFALSTEKPQGYVSDHSDCNDKDKDIHPNGPSLCDGKDNDCDGLIDEKCGVQATTANGQLQLSALPNPSVNHFTLRLQSSSNKPVELRIINEVGKVIEVKRGVASNATLSIGHSYRSGIYYVEVVQDGKRTSLKLLKQTP